VDEEQPLDEGLEPTPRIVLEGLDETPPEFVNFMQVAYDASTFRVAFCRYLPQFPLRADDLAAYYSAIRRDGYRTEVVSQLIVTPAVLDAMVRALQEHLSAYEAQWGPILPQTSETKEHNDGPDGASTTIEAVQ
jgi:hypothetical protein